MHRKTMRRSFFCVSLLCAPVSGFLAAQTGTPTGPQVSVQSDASASASSAPATPSIASGFDSISQAPGPTVSSPLTQPTLSPGTLLLLQLDGELSQAVAGGGGKVFASWFADDAVTLNNGRPAVYGRATIAAEAQWDPKVYQLTWIPQNAQMGPSNDMGYTWGRYEGHSKDKNGEPVVIAGRYITVWKKLPSGKWKISLEASANDAPATGDCCALPKP